ncbi:MAG: helix-turn-helix transcriptional regulator [Rhodobiaceae bacterium]|nr:helix-turn-helix transcriptional regulator [Rhodobiaceae bacterium]
MISVDNTYQDLLSAAAGDIPFEAAIEGLTRHFGAGGGIIFELNRKTGEIYDFATPNLIIGEEGYDKHINAINPRMKFSLRHAAGHVVHEKRFISDREMDRHEFYDWLKDIADFRYFLGTRLFDVGDVSIFHSIEFTPRHGAPGDDKIAAFSRMASAVGNAWRLRHRKDPGTDGATAAAWTPDHLPWAIFAHAKDGAVVSMNAAAKRLLDEDAPLEIALDTLRPRDRATRPAFRSALAKGLSGKTAEVLIGRPQSRLPLIAQIVPLDAPGTAHASRIAAITYVWDPLSQDRDIGRPLAALFGFTAAEQELARVLATGADLATVGERLGLSRNTVRNRLQSMYAKTGTNRQSEFLLHILGIMER